MLMDGDSKCMVTSFTSVRLPLSAFANQSELSLRQQIPWSHEQIMRKREMKCKTSNSELITFLIVWCLNRHDDMHSLAYQKQEGSTKRTAKENTSSI
jgi:hypothetical protein